MTIVGTPITGGGNLTRSFTGYTPPPRYDGQAFASAHIRESDAADGTYTTIDTVALFPLDTDPADPVSRNLTTDEATVVNGWYIIRWVDGLGSYTDTDPISYATLAETEDARAKISRMVDAETEPVLTAEDLDDLVDAAARADENGLYRNEAGWIATYDYNAAAAEGWARKASKAAANFNFAEDGQRFDRAQIYAHCAAQQKVYADKAMGSLPLTT
jgi:hypothetical protein